MESPLLTLIRAGNLHVGGRRLVHFLVEHGAMLERTTTVIECGCEYSCDGSSNALFLFVPGRMGTLRCTSPHDRVISCVGVPAAGWSAVGKEKQ